MLTLNVFLVHVSRRLKWAFFIAHPPSSVRPSSVKFNIFNFFSRIAQWILMKFGRDEVLLLLYKCCCFSVRSAKGRIQGGAKIGHGGPFLQETSFSDRKATATNRMYSNDLEACGKKCFYFSIHSAVKCLMRFDVFLDFVIFLVLMQCFLCGRMFNLHLFCVISMFDLNALRTLMNFYVFI